MFIVVVVVVVLVPGTGGSQLQAKINKPDVPHWYCTKKTETYFTLWLKKTSLLPFAIDCWVDNMRYGERLTIGTGDLEV